MEERYLPHPNSRLTYGAYHTPEEALKAGRDLLYLLNGMPVGFSMTVFERLGKFVLVSHPKEN